MSLNINKEDNRITNHLPVEGKLEKWTGRPVTQHRIADTESFVAAPSEKEQQAMLFRSEPEAISRTQPLFYQKQNVRRPSSEPEEPQAQQREVPQERQTQERRSEQPQRRVTKREMSQQEVFKKSQAREQKEPIDQQVQQQDKTKKSEREQQDERFGFGRNTRQMFSSRK